jgi:hypothetical protein
LEIDNDSVRVFTGIKMAFHIFLGVGILGTYQMIRALHGEHILLSVITSISCKKC